MRRLRWVIPAVCLLTLAAGGAPAGATTTPPDCAESSATMHFSPPLQQKAAANEVVTLKIDAGDCGAHGDPTTIQSATVSLTFPGTRLNSCKHLLSSTPWTQRTTATGHAHYQPAGVAASTLSRATLSQSGANPPDEASFRVRGNVVNGSFAGDEYGVFMLPDKGVAELSQECATAGLATLHAGAAEFDIG